MMVVWPVIVPRSRQESAGRGETRVAKMGGAAYPVGHHQSLSHAGVFDHASIEGRSGSGGVDCCGGVAGVLGDAGRGAGGGGDADGGGVARDGVLSDRDADGGGLFREGQWGVGVQELCGSGGERLDCVVSAAGAERGFSRVSEQHRELRSCGARQRVDDGGGGRQDRGRLRDPGVDERDVHVSVLVFSRSRGDQGAEVAGGVLLPAGVRRGGGGGCGGLLRDSRREAAHPDRGGGVRRFHARVVLPGGSEVAVPDVSGQDARRRGTERESPADPSERGTQHGSLQLRADGEGREL